MTDEEIVARIRQGEDSRTQFRREPIGFWMKAGVSVARSPLIFSYATKEMPYRGLGTGVKRALELGAKVDFVSDRELNVFKAILYPAPSVNPPVNGNLPENLAEIVAYLVANPTATYEQMSRHFSKTRETIRVYIDHLKNPLTHFSDVSVRRRGAIGKLSGKYKV